jgi:hypothetical protein
MTDQTISKHSVLSRANQARCLACATTLLTVTLLLMGVNALSASAGGTLDARTAYLASTGRALPINDKARMHLTGGSGNTLIEEGDATGTLPGKTKVNLTIVNTTTARSTFTVYPRGGSIAGHGTVRLHPGKSGSYESFRGVLSVSHGTGNYAHTSGSGNIYGVLNRSNDNAEVQVIGTLRY